MLLQVSALCGRIWDATGVRHDPERISGLTTLPIPTKGSELYTFLSACGWMRQSIPDYARLEQPLRIILDAILSDFGANYTTAREVYAAKGKAGKSFETVDFVFQMDRESLFIN